MIKKDFRKQLEDASEAWVLEKPQERSIICFMGDREQNTTTSGIHGREDILVETIVNEMLADVDVSTLIVAAVDVYMDIRLEESKNENRRIKTKPLS